MGSGDVISLLEDADEDMKDVVCRVVSNEDVTGLRLKQKWFTDTQDVEYVIEINNIRKDKKKDVKSYCIQNIRVSTRRKTRMKS